MSGSGRTRIRLYAMTTVTIAAEPAAAQDIIFRAFAFGREATGATPGQALDALTADLDLTANGSTVFILDARAVEFFTAEQQRRLLELKVRHRAALDSGMPMPPGQLAELRELAESTTEASGRRVEAILHRARP